MEPVVYAFVAVAAAEVSVIDVHLPNLAQPAGCYTTGCVGVCGSSTHTPIVEASYGHRTRRKCEEPSV